MVAIRQNGWQLAAIQAGGAICLPVLIIGHLLAKNYGEFSAYLSIGIGNGLLFLLAIVSAFYSVETRKSTVECAIDCFGNRGKIFFALAMVSSMTGWFAIQLHLMAVSLDELFHIQNGTMSTCLLGIVMLCGGMLGMKGVGLLANISLPLLIGTIGYAVVGAGERVETLSSSFLLTTSGISLVLAASIAAVIDLPTFFRFARSKKDALFALFLLFGVILPFLEGVGVFLYTRNQGGNFLEVLLVPPFSSLWKFWVLSFVLLAGWTTNSANLYSAVVSLQIALPKLSFKKGTLWVGFFGTLLASLDLSSCLEIILEPIGIILGSMGSVMIVTFLFDQKKISNIAMVAWLLGILGGLLSLKGVSLTEIPVLDAFIVSFVAMGALLFIPSSLINYGKYIYEND